MLDRGDLESLAEQGLTRRQIARVLECSASRVQYWMSIYGIESKHKSKRESTPESIAGRAAGLPEIWQVCGHHGRARHVLEGSGYYRCVECRADRVVARRRKVKEILVAEAGGACVICGYDHFPGGLQFHHLDPKQKAFGLASGGFARSLECLRKEAAKCVLLCGNCHAEVEGGYRALPIK